MTGSNFPSDPGLIKEETRIKMDIKCRVLAKANGNDKYKVFLMISIHCRPIYGTDREVGNGALAKTPIL
jgi:preprotein translocase subunit SecB